MSFVPFQPEPQPELPITPEMVMEFGMELWDGLPFRKPPADEVYAPLLLRLTMLFVEHVSRLDGLTFSGDTAGFVLSKRPATVLSPYAALFRDRGTPAGDFHDHAPEIAVEYVSADHPRRFADDRRARWFAAGSEQVWYFQAETRSMEVYTAGGGFERLQQQRFFGRGTAEGLEFDVESLFSGEGW
jgi:hypothetical protein